MKRHELPIDPVGEGEHSRYVAEVHEQRRGSGRGKEDLGVAVMEQKMGEDNGKMNTEAGLRGSGISGQWKVYQDRDE